MTGHLATRHAIAPRGAWRRHAPIALALCVGLALSLAAFVAVRNREERRLRIRFSRLAGDRVAAVHRGVVLSIEQLRSIRALFAASQLVERHEFAAFVHDALAQHRAIELLAWAPRVPRAARAAFEAEASRDAQAEFRITDWDAARGPTPAADRPVHYPIHYVMPREGHEGLRGRDLASVPALAQAMADARETQQARGVEEAGLAAEGGEGVEFDVVLPIYRGGEHQGFAVGVFRVGALVREALGHLSMEGAEIRLHDRTPGEAPRLLYPWRPGDPAPAEEDDPAAGDEPMSVSSFHVGGRMWTVVCRPTAEFFAVRRTWQAWGVLVAGPLLTALVAFYVASLTGRAHRIEQLVGERTAALRRAKESLEREIAQRERMEAELEHERNLLRALIDNMPDYIFVKDAHSRFVVNNAAHVRILGAASAAEVAGKTDFEFFPRELAERYFADERQVIDAGQPIVNREEPVVQPSGATRWVSTTKVPLRDSSGAVVGLVGISRDVTERKRAQEKIEALNAELEERVVERTRELAVAYEELRTLDHVKSVFIDVITHELCTPLMVMSGMLALLQRRLGERQPELLETLAKARRASARLERLITRILEVAQAGDFARQLHTSPTDPAAVVRDVVADATPFVELRHQTLSTDLPDDLPLVAMDRAKVHDALLNLVMNAVKFTPDGGSLAVAVAPRDGQAVEFRVTDTGVGIAEADLPHVFDEFFTTFDTMHHGTGDYEFQRRGAGVGLAIVKSFVEMHHGQVGVESAPDEGSTFWFVLPLQPPPQTA